MRHLACINLITECAGSLLCTNFAAHCNHNKVGLTHQSWHMPRATRSAQPSRSLYHAVSALRACQAPS